MIKIHRFIFGMLCLVCLWCATVARGNDSLIWRVKQDKVDADIKQWDLPEFLKKIAVATGWKVYVEPGATDSISVKFKGLPSDDALQRCLGKLNYAKTSTNGVTKLFVFKTVANAATQLVHAEKALRKDYRIPNELIVRLKSNSTMSIDQLAKLLGAKIAGRDDRLKLYRLQFADEADADAAVQTMSGNDSVASVSSNYIVDRPAPVQMTPVGGAGGPQFDLNPKPPISGPIIGLVDTAVQPQDQFKQYMLTPISVVGAPEAPTTEPSHGTSMFETMLSAMSDAPSKILPVDVYGSGESTSTFEVAEGIIAAVNAGANPINLSLGGTGDSDVLRSLIAEASQKGVQFVAAAGNTPGTSTTFPAAYPGVVAVTAVQNGQLASYADDGSFVNASASGTSYVTWNGEDWVVEGTSPATATITGTIMEKWNEEHGQLSQIVNQVMKSNPPPK